MSSLAELLALRELDLDQAAEFLGTSPDSRQPIKGYGALRDVDALDSKDRGIRFLLHGNRIRLVYLGRGALPEGTKNEDLVAVAESNGDLLRSRQAKRARLHVAAGSGLAWSELDGRVGFVELFAPTTLDDYLDQIYEEPPKFIQ